MSRTKIKFLFHGDTEPIEFTVLTYIVQQWIKMKKPIQNLRKLGTVLDFKEF